MLIYEKHFQGGNMKQLTYFILVIFSIILTKLSAREQILLVGSSTLYPFATIIAEKFNKKNPQYKTPVVEAVGTGGGFKMFCHSPGLDSPDISNASRKIKDSERQICKKNGVDNIIEITLGYDAIVIIHPKTLKSITLTKEQIYLALAEKVPASSGAPIDNPYKKWSEIDSSLPDMPIKVMGPPSTSGTRDTFVELVMETSCHNNIKNNKLKVSEDKVQQLCKSIRSDGPYIDGGENDTLFIQKVTSSKDTLAILSYSYFENNQKNVSAVLIEGIAPSRKSFDAKTYPLFRELYMYIKADNIDVVVGLKDFVNEIINKGTIGSNGYLKKSGLISLSDNEYNAMIEKIKLN